MKYFRLSHNLLLPAIFLFGIVGCRSANHKEVDSSDNKPRLSQTELFNLRTECARLTQKIYDEKKLDLEPFMLTKNYAWFHHVEQNSNYDPATNRCYAELTTQTTDRAGTGYERWSVELYDAQTKDMLASTQKQISSGNRPPEADAGMVFAYTSTPYDNNYEGASRFISERMTKLY